MKNLLIIGARAFGREMYSLATYCEGYNRTFTVKGFLDDNADAMQSFAGYPPIISSVENYSIQSGDVFICALGDIKWKKHYISIILSKGGEFINLVHPSNSINHNAKLGKGIIIGKYCIISNDILIDDFVTIHSYCTLSHDIKIGKWSNISGYSFIGGYAVLEEEVNINTRATILPNLKIGSCASVGAASLVIKNVKDNTSVFGIPAKIIKF